MNASNPIPRRFSGATLALVAMMGFAAGYIVRSPSTTARIIDGASSLPRPIPDAELAQQAADTEAPANLKTDAPIVEVQPETVSLGDMTLGAMTDSQWATYRDEVFQKNPGFLQLEGFAALLADEFAGSNTSMTADAAMKSAVERASRRWIQAHNKTSLTEAASVSTSAATDTTGAASEDAVDAPTDAGGREEGGEAKLSVDARQR